MRALPVLLTLPVAALSAVDIQDKDTSLSLFGYTQVVAAKGTSATAAGAPFNATEGKDGRADQADLYLRRLRVGLRWKQDAWQAQVILASDNAGRTPEANATPGVTLYEAYGTRTWVLGSVTQAVTLGKQLPWFNTAASRSSTLMLPASRASAEFLAPNSVGAGYRLQAPVVKIGLDVQNNTGDDTANQSHDGEGLCATARVELTGPDADHGAIATWQESFAGAAGHGAVLGLEAGTNRFDQTSSGRVTTDVLGVDLLLHWDGLSALVDVARQTKTTDTTTSSERVHGQVALAQAGYAVAWDGVGVVEPAVRGQLIDLNRENGREGSSFGGKDYGTSGRELDAGLTCYWSGHRLKTSAVVTRWRGETNDAGTPRATIVRVQQQIQF